MTHIADASFDDRRARRNAVVLAVAGGLYGCSTFALVVTAGLVGMTIAPDKGLATLPVSAFVVGTALTTVPASFIMRRIGRQAGFMIGAMTGCVAGLLAAYAILSSDFVLFTLAALLHGIYQAFSQYYRFAAADTASPAFRPKAISWVMVGGIAGAVFGPLIVINTKDLLEPVPFAGTYLASAALAVAALGVLIFLDIPHQRTDHAEAGRPRPLAVILRQPRLLAAILSGMTAYGVMNLVMTATPIAMVGCGFSVDQSAWVIQWHALAMFVPSFFTGHLIARFGVERIVLAGMALLAFAAAAALAGISFLNFALGLILLGLGWNFGYIGGTTMVTECYLPSEKNKVQAFNDFAIFLTVACASLVSGKVLDAVGWNAVNWLILPVVALTCACLLWLGAAQLRQRTVG